jgi:hypothetical protein
MKSSMNEKGKPSSKDSKRKKDGSSKVDFVTKLLTTHGDKLFWFSALCFYLLVQFLTNSDSSRSLSDAHNKLTLLTRIQTDICMAGLRETPVDALVDLLIHHVEVGVSKLRHELPNEHAKFSLDAFTVRLVEDFRFLAKEEQRTSPLKKLLSSFNRNKGEIETLIGGASLLRGSVQVSTIPVQANDEDDEAADEKKHSVVAVVEKKLSLSVKEEDDEDKEEDNGTDEGDGGGSYAELV